MLSGCGHELCVRCALYLCSTSNIPSGVMGPPGSIPCPLCRHGIVSFVKIPGSPAKENKQHMSLALCTPCMLHPRDPDRQSPACTPDIRRNRVVSVSSDMLCPVTCSPFPSVTIPLCTCNDDPCPSFETREGEAEDASPNRSQAASVDQDKMEGPRFERTTCSSMFWGRRSCSREHQCNSEINTWPVWLLDVTSYSWKNNSLLPEIGKSQPEVVFFFYFLASGNCEMSYSNPVVGLQFLFRWLHSPFGVLAVYRLSLRLLLLFGEECKNMICAWKSSSIVFECEQRNKTKLCLVHFHSKLYLPWLTLVF